MEVQKTIPETFQQSGFVLVQEMSLWKLPRTNSNFNSIAANIMNTMAEDIHTGIYRNRFHHLFLIARLSVRNNIIQLLVIKLKKQYICNPSEEYGQLSAQLSKVHSIPSAGPSLTPPTHFCLYQAPKGEGQLCKDFFAGLAHTPIVGKGRKNYARSGGMAGSRLRPLWNRHLDAQIPLVIQDFLPLIHVEWHLSQENDEYAAPSRVMSTPFTTFLLALFIYLFGIYDGSWCLIIWMVKTFLILFIAVIFQPSDVIILRKKKMIHTNHQFYLKFFKGRF